MNRRFLPLLCWIGVAIVAWPVHAATYSIVRLTDNDIYDSNPVINSSGHIAWSGGGEIFLYDGSRVIQLTDNDYPDHADLSISDCGHVAWSGGPDDLQEIYLYDDGEITQITDDPPGSIQLRDRTPDVNDSGHLVWMKFRTVMYHDGITNFPLDTQVSGSPYPRQNNSGQVAWQADLYNRQYIFYHDADGLRQLTYDGRDGDPAINELGTIVWTRDTYWSKEVMLWDGTDEIHITNNDVLDIGARINDNDDVVWMRGFGTDREIYGFSLGEEGRITHNDLEEVGLNINNSGVIVFNARVGSAWELFVYDGSEHQLTNTGVTNWAPRINDGGQIVWTAWGGTLGEDYEVFLATPDDLVIDVPDCGDPDEDGDEDDDEDDDEGSDDDESGADGKSVDGFSDERFQRRRRLE